MTRPKRTPEFRTWAAMIERCHTGSNPAYKRYYKDRGITVCERWRHSFENFLADMGNRPPGTSLDRIDNAKGYEPGNCRWVDHYVQCNNMRKNVMITYNGKTKSVSEWSRITGIKNRTLHQRIAQGWPPEVALTRKPAKGIRADGSITNPKRRTS